MARQTLQGTLEAAKRVHGLEPDWSLYQPKNTRSGLYGNNFRISASKSENVGDSASHFADEQVVQWLRREPMTLDDLADKLGCSKGGALDRIEAMTEHGIAIQRLGDRYGIAKEQAPSFAAGNTHEYRSRADHSFVFGVIADTHLGSRYCRLDVLNEAYDIFAEAKVDRVFHAGNYIEGEIHFNRHELVEGAHGMDAQLAFLAANYPKRDGIVTYAVSGDDHEGWYSKREGVDIGRYAERVMREAGREDWVDLGYLEAHISLVNAATGKSHVLACNHPGGGASYADSYVVQKIVESLEGGEKPAVALYGHYHKQLAGECRNVWWLMPGAMKDQDIFMRKNRLRSVIGCAVVALTQDPETGAITSFTPQMFRWFDRDFHAARNGRWAHGRPVTLPPRAVNLRATP
jgi:predicted phosphodiesterase/biotin operon repressor